MARRTPSGSQSPPPRPRRADGLALRRAMPDRLLPALVAAMAFLAALALAGAVGASLLAARWSTGAAAILTVQVPDGDAPAVNPAAGSRLQAVLALLSTDPAIAPAIAAATPLDRARLVALLAPWLGPVAANQPATGPGTGPGASDDGANRTALALPLPAVVQVTLKPGRAAPIDLAARLDQAAPGTLAERNQDWSDRLVALTTSLQACAGIALLVVALVAIAVVAAATRAGLAARRQAIEIVHGLGAGDGYIAGRFSRRTTGLAFTGGIAGTLLSVPLLLLLCRLAAPFAGPAAALPDFADTPLGDWLAQTLSRVPLLLWIALPLLPPVAAAIGWTTTQATVRTWLRRLP